MYRQLFRSGGYEPSIVASQTPVRRGSNRYNDLVLEDSVDDGETLVGDGKAGILHKKPLSTDLHLYAKLPAPSSGSKKPARLGGLSGPISSNLSERDRGRLIRARSAKNTTPSESPNSSTLLDAQPGLDLKNTSRLASSKERRTSAHHRPKKNIDSFDESPPTSSGSVLASKTLDDILSADPDSRLKSVTSTPAAKHKETARERSSLDDVNGDTAYTFPSDDKSACENLNTKTRAKDVESLLLGNKPKQKNQVGDLELGDLDDIEDAVNDLELCNRMPILQPSFAVDSQPIDIKTAVELKTLVLGSPMRNFNSEWHYQSLTFSDLPKLKYGLIQKKGGPCGVMASIQACLLQELLFANKHKPTYKDLDPSREQRSRALSSALATIFWRCGSGTKAVVALPGMRVHFTNSSRIRTDNITEMLTLNTLTSKEDLTAFLQQNIRQFELDGSSGVILALYSAILSRTIKGVREDMDEPNNILMGTHGYSTQEMVNLFLTGHAASNVFNDIVELDSGTGSKTVLKGIQCRSDIGLLSLFEHYKSCQVGTYLKTPKYAIWVVCSESHFSVLFSLKEDLLNDWKAEKRFDLYYYDGLAKQDTEIRLTIDTTNRMFQAPSEDDLVPPLEHCIRTKWPDAEINWNGTEPLL